VMRSPLTGIVFTLELTHAWNDLPALLVASISAYALSALVLKRSALTEKVARRGLHLTREYSTDPLEALFAHEVMTPDPATLPATDLLDHVLHRIARAARHPRQHHALHLVTGAAGHLVGVLPRSALLRAADTEPAHRTVGELARPARAVVFADHTLREVANILARHNVTRAPVVHRDQPHKLAGIITLDQLLHARRRDLHEEHHRERLIPVRRPGPPGPGRQTAKRAPIETGTGPRPTGASPAGTGPTDIG